MRKLLIPLIAIAAALGSAQAVTVVLNGPNGSDLLNNGSSANVLAIGTIIDGNQPGPGQLNEDIQETNNLLSVALGTYSTFAGDEHHRTFNSPLATPTVVAAGAVLHTDVGGLMTGTNAFGAIVSITLTNVFSYLFVAYDGPNGGDIVYDVSSLPIGTVIELPRYARPSGSAGSLSLVQDTGQYQMTGWTLLNATTQFGNGVPDGGSAIALLGIALIGLEGLRRKLRTA